MTMMMMRTTIKGDYNSNDADDEDGNCAVRYKNRILFLFSGFLLLCSMKSLSIEHS